MISGNGVRASVTFVNNLTEEIVRLAKFRWKACRGKVPTKQNGVGGRFERVQFLRQEVPHRCSKLLHAPSNDEIADTKQAFSGIGKWVEGNIPEVQISDMERSKSRVHVVWILPGWIGRKKAATGGFPSWWPWGFSSFAGFGQARWNVVFAALPRIPLLRASQPAGMYSEIFRKSWAPKPLSIRAVRRSLPMAMPSVI